MQPPPHPSNPFSAYTTATPPSLAFSPPPGYIASPAPSHSTPRPIPARYQSPSTLSLPLPPIPSEQSTATGQRKRAHTGAGPSTLGGRSTTGAGGGAGVASALEDPVLEARRVLGVLIGVGVGDKGEEGGGGGLIGEIERGLNLILQRWESSFDESIDAPDLNTVLTSLTTLLHLLRNSPIGGLSISQSPTEVSAAAVQKLFRERQRGREGAEIAGGILGSAN